MPHDLIKVLNLDLAAAGINKEDGRSRTVDLYALRHTFGTHLSKNGVAPRAAQAAMRHSSLDLTVKHVAPRRQDTGAPLRDACLVPSPEQALAGTLGHQPPGNRR